MGRQVAAGCPDGLSGAHPAVVRHQQRDDETMMRRNECRIGRLRGARASLGGASRSLAPWPFPVFRSLVARGTGTLARARYVQGARGTAPGTPRARSPHAADAAFKRPMIVALTLSMAHQESTATALWRAQHEALFVRDSVLLYEYGYSSDITRCNPHRVRSTASGEAGAAKALADPRSVVRRDGGLAADGVRGALFCVVNLNLRGRGPECIPDSIRKDHFPRSAPISGAPQTWIDAYTADRVVRAMRSAVDYRHLPDCFPPSDVWKLRQQQPGWPRPPPAGH